MEDREKNFYLVVGQIRTFITNCIGFKPDDTTGGDYGNNFTWRIKNSDLEIMAFYGCGWKKEQDFFDYYLTINGKRITGSYSFDTQLTYEDEKAISKIIQPFKDAVVNELTYKYFLISIRDNDFYSSLSAIGEIFVKVFGYKFADERVNFERFKEYLPSLVCSVFASLQRVHYVLVHDKLKICYTPEEINEYIKTYGMCPCKDYINPLLADRPVFTDVVHCDCDAEALIIKLVYDKENNYIEEKSDWLVI